MLHLPTMPPLDYIVSFRTDYITNPPVTLFSLTLINETETSPFRVHSVNAVIHQPSQDFFAKT